VAIAVEELVEEELAEMVVAEVDCYEHSSEALGGVTLDVVEGVVHEGWETGVPLVEGV